MEIRLLGPLEVVAGGRVHHFRGAGERALLALLALQPGRVVPADRLIDALWEEELPADARAALQVRVSKLRKALRAAGEDVLATRSPGYTLTIDEMSVDVSRFESAVSAARHAAGTGDRRGAVTLYHDALSLRRGPPLADFDGHSWAAAEVRRLEALHLAAMEEWLGLEVELGHHLEVMGELDRLLAAYPLRERLHGLRMIALYRAGRQADALAAYQAARDVLGDELGLDPMPELRQLQAAILRQDPALGASPELHSGAVAPPLPSRLTPLVGRAAELEQLVALLTEHRLVTVTGPGGAGKTTIALEAGRIIGDRFGDGVWLVELAGVRQGGDVATALGSALGLGPQPSSDEPAALRLPQQLREWDVLLLVDNCEHVIDDSAELLERLLRSCPSLRILATSREALAVQGEVQFELAPLEAPPEDEDADSLADYPAVQLFTDRARAASRHFVADDATVAAMAEICRRLDGMPLAIELAAARITSLSPSEIAARLDDRFAVLARGTRTAEARHRTLRATVDWSHALLSGAERVLFRRLSVFRSWWDLAAAQEVCAGDGVGRGDVIDLVVRLADRSLLVTDTTRGRFRILETIRQYAEERLEAAAETELVQGRHAAWVLRLAERTSRDLRGAGQRAAFDRLRELRDDVRAALWWCRENPPERGTLGLTAAGALGWFWYLGDQDEGRRQLRTLLAEVRDQADPAACAAALQAVALVERPGSCIVHPSARCAEAAAASIPLFRSVGNVRDAAVSQVLHVVEGVRGGDRRSWLARLDEAVAELGAADDAWGLALASFVRMEILARAAAVDEAIAHGDAAATSFASVGDLWGVSAVRSHQAYNLHVVGRAAEAAAAYEEALALAQGIGWQNSALLSAGLGIVRIALGDDDGAAEVLTQVDEYSRRAGFAGGSGLAHVGFGYLARRRNDIDDAGEHFERAVASQRGGSAAFVAMAWSGLAYVRDLQGDADGAAAAQQAVLETAREFPEPGRLAMALEGLGRVAVRTDPQRAAALIAAARDIRRRRHRPLSQLERPDVERTVDMLRRRLGPDAIDRVGHPVDELDPDLVAMIEGV